MMNTFWIFYFFASVHASFPTIKSFTGPEYKLIPFQLETLTLKCTAHGEPLPSISFVRNGTKLQPGPSVTIAQGTLTISQVDYVKDNGFYQCLARNKYGAVLSNVIDIKVRVLGRFVQLHRNIDPSYFIDAAVGRPMEIRCPPHTYTFPRHVLWGDIRTTGRPVVLHPNSKRFVLSNGNLFYSYLEDSDINEINNKLSGVSCILYILGKYRPSVKLKLKKQGTITSDFKPIFRERLPSIAPVKIGASYTYFCAAAGKPLPTILWYYNNAQIRTGTPGIIISSTGHKLTLQSVGRASSGLYYCQVQNRLGTLRSASQLKVEFPPSRNPTLRDKKSGIGIDVKFNCTGEGTKPVSYEWYRNGERLYSNYTYHISTGVLLIKKANATSSGIYQCMSRNIHGSLLSNVHLDVKKGYGNDSDDSKFSWEIIVGIVCGGVAFIIIVTVGAYFFLR